MSIPLSLDRVRELQAAPPDNDLERLIPLRVAYLHSGDYTRDINAMNAAIVDSIRNNLSEAMFSSPRAESYKHDALETVFLAMGYGVTRHSLIRNGQRVYFMEISWPASKQTPLPGPHAVDPLTGGSFAASPYTRLLRNPFLDQAYALHTATPLE